MTASVEFTLGAESVTVPLDIQTGDETILTGDIGGLVAAGTTARLRGNCRLIADLHVRGTLLCDESGVDLDGQGFDIHTHDGTLNLVGVEKTAWARWGDVVVGWQIGDRLAVAPTAVAVYVAPETTWQGSWAATTRPANTADFTQLDGTVIRPEVANLSQTVTLRNLKRIMVHESTASNPQTLKWIKVLNSGEAGVLGHYPIHFHLIGDHSRGTLIEGVVVEGGKNHAFVPHASHGITLRDTVAYKTQSSVYWWDDGDATHDLTFDHCLALGAVKDATNHVTGFNLAAGTGSLVDCAAAGIVGGVQASSGFQWPSFVGNWASNNLVAHNNNQTGIYVWNNGGGARSGTNWFTFRNTRFGVVFGAYQNPWVMSGVVASENFRGNDANADVELHAVPFANTPQPRLINSRVRRILQGHHNVQTAANGLLPTLVIDVELDSFKVADDVGMWVDFVRCIKNGTDLEPGDIEIISADASCRWRGQRRDGTAWQKLPNGTVTVIPPFWE